MDGRQWRKGVPLLLEGQLDASVQLLRAVPGLRAVRTGPPQLGLEHLPHLLVGVRGEPGGNVAEAVWEGALPPAEIPLENLSRPPFNCGLFFCQDPGGRHTVDPRIPVS